MVNNIVDLVKEKKMKDKCVSCGVETLYDKTEHVDFRLGYVEGAGQLCLGCYEKIYIKQKKKENRNENGTLV